jgi:hypothetical protein
MQSLLHMETLWIGGGGAAQVDASLHARAYLRKWR